jgi:hypothetical protein
MPTYHAAPTSILRAGRGHASRAAAGLFFAMVGCSGDASNGASGGGAGGSEGLMAGSAGAAATTSGSGGLMTAPGAAPPALHTEGSHFVDGLGRRAILRGVALPDLLELDTERPGMSVSGMIDRVSDEADGFYARVVRLTVYPERWLPDPARYLEEHLRPAVEHASSRGLYVIVDWHEISDVAPVAQRTAEFWRRVAPEFASSPNVLYELFNEPIDMEDASWSRWKTHAQPWVNAIRAVADNVILIGGPFWSQRIEGAATDPFEGTNLGYVGHVYPIIDPNTWAPGGAFDQVAAVRPLFITEWGYRADGGPIWNGTRQSFGEPLRAFVEPRGISWTAWCADSLWAPVMFDASWRLLTGDTEMGGFVKEWLAGSRDDNEPTPLDIPPPAVVPPDAASCVPASSPSQVVLDGRVLAGPLRLQGVSCLGNLTVEVDTCSHAPALNDCIYLSVRLDEPPTGSGTYYDGDGVPHELDVTGGTLDREAFLSQKPIEATLTGTKTAPEVSAGPFELHVAGCSEPLQVCLL